LRLAPLALAIALALCAGQCAGGERTLKYGDTAVHEAIPAGGFQAFVVQLKIGDLLEVRLAEESSARVDFYLTNYTAYLAYRGVPVGIVLDFYYIAGGASANSAPQIEYSYRAMKADKMVVIVDNSNRTAEGASGVAPVTVVGQIKATENIWTLKTALIGALVVGCMIGVIYAVLRVGHKPHAEQAKTATVVSRRHFFRSIAIRRKAKRRKPVPQVKAKVTHAPVRSVQAIHPAATPQRQAPPTHQAISKHPAAAAQRQGPAPRPTQAKRPPSTQHTQPHPSKPLSSKRRMPGR
jgi:hypothetical protein